MRQERALVKPRHLEVSDKQIDPRVSLKNSQRF